jgi:tetratricopeptide (TPR) repeat protein
MSVTMPRILPSILLLGIVLSGRSSASSADEWLVKADRFEQQGQTKEALAALVEADKLLPNRPEILVRIAKQHGDLMTEQREPAARKASALKALAFSRRALEIDERHSDAHLAVAISLGKKTEFMGNREKIETSREIRQHAERALALNPKCDYAHHMLGRWHQELAGVGGATRALARLIYGRVPSASYEDAVRHFERARALRPDRLIHKIEHGRTLAIMGRTAEARELLVVALEMPSRDKDDEEAKQRGRATLRGIR